MGFFPFFFPFLLNSVDTLCGGLVNISLETVKYLCKFQRSQFEINEGCSARTMTNLFHLPAQQEEAAIPAEREPRACFSVSQVSKGLWGIQQNLPFWRARFIEPPYPQNNWQNFFLIKKGGNGQGGLGTVFSRSNDRISVSTCEKHWSLL